MSETTHNHETDHIPGEECTGDLLIPELAGIPEDDTAEPDDADTDHQGGEI